MLRLEQLGIYREGSHRRWKQSWHNIGNPDFSESSGGSGTPPPQEKVKLAKYGFRMAAVFDSLQNRSLINELDIYRISGLKPKYQRAYFDYAKELGKSEVQSLERLDE